MADDDLVGELFLDNDPRADGRVVKIINRVIRTRPGSGQQVAYVAKVVKHRFAENLGRVSTISEKTLQTRYKKVSH